MTHSAILVSKLTNYISDCREMSKSSHGNWKVDRNAVDFILFFSLPPCFFPHKDLKNSIRVFSESNNLLVKCEKTWKLHILIPLNCVVYDNLWKADSHIQFINNLPEVSVDRAGIKRRTYKSCVYGVLDENQKVSSTESSFCDLSSPIPSFPQTILFRPFLV